jgi:hypothetical protein
MSPHWTPDDYEKASFLSVHNKSCIEDSEYVGCYHCLAVYSSQEVKEYTDDDTALCPYCGVDSLLGNKSDFPVGNPDFLQHMNWYGFCHVTMANGSITTTKKPSCLYCHMNQQRVPDKHYTIEKIELISSVCPFQLEGLTTSGEIVHIREKNGVLQIEIGNNIIFRSEGFHNMRDNYEELKNITKSWFTWPQKLSHDR